MREITIAIDAETEIGLRTFMERMHTPDEAKAAGLALRAMMLMIEPGWLSYVIQNAVREEARVAVRGPFSAGSGQERRAPIGRPAAQA